MTQPTCGVCGRPVTIEDLDDPPTFTYIKIGVADDGKAIMAPRLSKPMRIDPETGAVCWCPTEEGT